MNPYFDPEATPWTELGDGIRRKIVGHTPALMSVLVQFDQGAVGIPHAHDAHDQIAYVLSGSFEAEVAGVRRVIRAGEAFVASRLQHHGVVALEAGSTLLDQFSPRGRTTSRPPDQTATRARRTAAPGRRPMTAPCERPEPRAEETRPRRAPPRRPPGLGAITEPPGEPPPSGDKE